MRRVISTFILLLSTLFVSAQFMADYFLKKVVMYIGNDTGKTNVGSGFILKKNDSYFIVSARHVTKSFNNTSRLAFSNDNLPRVGKAQFKYFRQLVNTKKQHLYNSELADISVIQLDSDSLLKYNISLDKFSVKYEDLNEVLEEVNRAFDVMAFGFPIYDFEHFAPITFKTSVASPLISIFDSTVNRKCQVLYLENPSMSGCSGGPVMMGLFGTYNKTKLIGVVKGTTYDSTGGKYSIIIPSFYVVELFKRHSL